jgi:hypothetical protein
VKSRKLAVIGRGTAGVMAMAELLKEFPKDTEFEWYYDSAINPQAVGEGSTLSVPRALFKNLGFKHQDLDHISGTFKHGIRKMNWSHDNPDYFHPFPPPSVGYHFNAVELQKYCFAKLNDRVKLIDSNVTADQVDASYVLDCSGRPKDYDLFHEAEYIPVNAAYVTQCFWELPRFFYTLTIARPYGWVFGIPLKNRCSIGYMFNDKITDLETIKEDVKNIFDQFNLTPSTTTNELHFNNYSRKVNFTKTHAFNGNASFFLEPLEATTLTGVDYVNKWTCELIRNPMKVNLFNTMYRYRSQSTERMIMLHYFAGSTFKTDFWEFAYERARRCLELAVNDPDWNLLYETSKTVDPENPDKNFKLLTEKKWRGAETDDWPDWSYYMNLSGMGMNLYDKLDQLKK